ncbi:unnamed protein product [Brassica rapa subsp. narinosa]
MSSFGRGHANLLYIVSILSDVLEGTPSLFSHFLFFSSSSDQHQHQLMRFTWKQNLRYYIGFLETLASGARKEAAKARTNPGLVVISRFGVAGFVNSNRDENIRKKSVNGRNEDASSALDPAPPAVPTPSAPPPPVKMAEEEAPKSILERNNNDVSPKPKKKAHMKRMGEEEKHSLMLLGETLLSGVPTLWDETEQGISEQVLKGDI